MVLHREARREQRGVEQLLGLLLEFARQIVVRRGQHLAHLRVAHGGDDLIRAHRLHVFHELVFGELGVGLALTGRGLEHGCAAQSIHLLVGSTHHGMAKRADFLLVGLHGVRGLGELRVAQHADQSVRPVEILGGHARGRVAQVGGRVVDVREERDHRVERIRTIGKPLHRAVDLRAVRANLHDGQMIRAIDADRAEARARRRVTERTVRVERGLLVV